MSNLMRPSEQKLIEAAVAISECRPEEEGALAFTMKALVAACLPYNRPKPEALVNGCWIRRNGKFALWAQGGPSGLPYGSYPRLFFLYTVTEALRCKSRAVKLGRFQTFCDRLGIDRSMGKRGQGRAMVDQVKRILDTRWAFIEDFDKGMGMHTHKMNFAEEAILWWDLEERKSDSLFESMLVLDPRMFEELSTHPVPLDMRAVAVLKSSPMALDIYQWLAYRMFSLRSPTKVRWESLQLQFGAEFSQLRDFRFKFRRAIKKVLVVYPEARIEDDQIGVLLRPSPTPVRRLQLSVIK